MFQTTCLSMCIVSYDFVRVGARFTAGYKGWNIKAKPILILDGHDSCFQLPFLEYMNKTVDEGMENRQWHICIRVPYGTHIWQVRDFLEQNKVFQNEMKQQK